MALILIQKVVVWHCLVEFVPSFELLAYLQQSLSNHVVNVVNVSCGVVI